MPQVSLQFHAEYYELARDLIPAWLSGEDYFVAVVKSGGTESTLIETGDMGLFQECFVPEILIRQDPFDDSQLDNFVDFLRANPGFLSVQPGRLMDSSLRESVIGATATNTRTLATWRAVLRRARRDLLSGALLIGPTGIRRDDPRHLYSKGALELANSGVTMLAAAGSVRFELAPV